MSETGEDEPKEMAGDLLDMILLAQKDNLVLRKLNAQINEQNLDIIKDNITMSAQLGKSIETLTCLNTAVVSYIHILEKLIGRVWYIENFLHSYGYVRPAPEPTKPVN